MSESSTTPNTSSPDSSIKIKSPDYNHFGPANPPFTRIIDNPVPAITPFIKVEIPEGRDSELPAPHTPEELIEIARLASGLMLKAEADKIPHVHYPFTNNNNNDKANAHSSDKKSHHKRKDLKNNNLNSRNKHCRSIESQKPHPLAHLGIFTRVYHCPSTAPRRQGDNRPLIRFYSKSYFDRQTGHFMVPLSEPKPEPKRRKMRLFYIRAFLAGPDAKTEVGDRRIFHQRKFVLREI
jgi:hypothetical protein